MTQIKRATAAERIGRLLWDHRGTTLTIAEICDGTHLTPPQVHAAEQSLKHVVAANLELFEGYTFHIAMGRESAHGFIQDSDRSLTDLLCRTNAEQTRLNTSYLYLSQAADRVPDADVRQRLRRLRRHAEQLAEDAADLVTEMNRS
jgi:hypothetical protein